MLTRAELATRVAHCGYSRNELARREQRDADDAARLAAAGEHPTGDHRVSWPVNGEDRMRFAVIPYRFPMHGPDVVHYVHCMRAAGVPENIVRHELMTALYVDSDQNRANMRDWLADVRSGRREGHLRARCEEILDRADREQP